MIWLGEKLFRIDNDYKATLEESYKKNLGNFMGNVNYWKVTDGKQLYKKATIKKMSEYYNLLNYICKLIIEYNKNPPKPNRVRLVNHYTQCDNFYKTIHNSINGCKPYLQLLDSLKMIYEIFRMYKIVNSDIIQAKEKTLLVKRIKSLTTFKGENQYFVTVNPLISFDDKECVKVKSNDEKIGEQIALKKSQDLGKSKNHIRGPQTRGSENAQRGNPGARVPAPPQSKQTSAPKQPERPPAKPPTAPSPQPKPKSEAKQRQASQQKASQSQTQPVEPVQSADTQQSGPSLQQTDSQQTDTQQTGPQKADPLPAVPPAPPSQDRSSLQTPKTGEIHQNGQGGPGDRKGETSSGSGVTQDNQGGSSGGSGDGQGSGAHGSGGTGVRSGDQSVKDSQEGIEGGKGRQGITSSESGGGPGASKSGQKASDSSKGNKDGGTNDGANGGAGTPGSGANGGGSTKGDQGNPSVGSNDQGDKSGGSSTSGGSFGLGSSFLEFILKGKEYYNKASEFIKDNQQKFKDAAEKISDAYNTAVDNLKSAYNVSSDYLNNFISNITSQLNQFDPPPKSDGNQTGSGSPTGGGNPSTPPIDPQPPSPQIPSPTSPQITPPAPPSSPIPNPIQDPSKSSLQQNQSPPQSQTITQQPAQVKQTNHQKIDQFIKSLSSDLILKKPWNIFPTTWNGSGDCKPEIKFMNATLVCCTSEQCSLTGITVILVLIPIILLIAYKVNNNTITKYNSFKEFSLL
ncbi:PIR protein CIR protein [Plasmodium vinckei petteri]|uniref:PIR protein CIR protein n=1 Tax=Plasmodium vinckei petteri TaxID=138298 RepID=A0A6V7SU85_PLAVN|nr:PIR protein CIR protein [Plasmodium vinckei petteri]